MIGSLLLCVVTLGLWIIAYFLMREAYFAGERNPFIYVSLLFWPLVLAVGFLTDALTHGWVRAVRVLWHTDDDQNGPDDRTAR
jgi:hypothetical protein